LSILILPKDRLRVF